MPKKFRHSIRNKWVCAIVSAVIAIIPFIGFAAWLRYCSGIASPFSFLMLIVGWLFGEAWTISADFLADFLFAPSEADKECD